jgi:hypothetical protein
VDGEGRNDRVHARPVGQTSVHVRGGVVDTAPHSADDLVDRPTKILLVTERDVRAVDLAPTFDVHDAVAVHHDLCDLRVADERLDRPQPEDVVADLLDDLRLLLDRERCLNLFEELTEPAIHEPAKLAVLHRVVVQARPEDLDQPCLDLIPDLGGSIRLLLPRQTFRKRHLTTPLPTSDVWWKPPGQAPPTT